MGSRNTVFQLEYVSGNNQRYVGGGMPSPMVFKIKNLTSNEYVSGYLPNSDLSLIAIASVGFQDADFNDLNDYCGNGDDGCYGGYYYVQPVNGSPYDLNITVRLRFKGELIDSYLITQYLGNMHGTFTDHRDGNVYNTVRIGDQVWMAENIKATRYEDGTPIPLVESKSEWLTLGNSDKAYCWYNNDALNRENYGGLYNWAAAMNGSASSIKNPSGVQGVCANGWHIPSDEEWKQLEMFIGMNQAAVIIQAGVERLKEVILKRLEPHTG
ncbi:MAG: hypothetical protein DRQ01_09240 [Ignavibacteriae bacterium]|nr:MAG: hypothetical protein DRQ01_09240 [Ignavibacteriota bacterium]